MDIQKKVNRRLLDLSKEMNIPIIHANDSHYIYPDDDKYRSIFLKGKNRNYPEEDGMVLDYPSDETILKRYRNREYYQISKFKKHLKIL